MLSYLYNLSTDRYRGFVPALIKALLLCLSFAYGLIVRVLSYWRLLQAKQLGVKVISVGNLTLGGTGKTSLVEYLARYLKAHHRSVAILTRGYKRLAAAEDLQAADYREMGDEPAMLKARMPSVPVIVDKDRQKAAARAVKEYQVDTVILDDGFQQWGIKKDLEIVTIDVGNPFGNRQMLPRGVLREPLSALRRADVIVLTKTNLYGCLGKLRQQLQEINPVALQAEAAYLPDGFYRLFDPQQGLSADELKGIDTCLLCAIADPDSFRKLMLSQGIAVRLFFKFPDHHFYSPQEIETLRRACAKNNIDKIITTEKDAVRLSRLREIKSKPEIIVFRMRLKITFNEERLLERLSGLYRL